MRVLHVLPYPGVGGTEIATRRVIDGVRAFGVESRVLLLRPVDELIAYFEAAGIPVEIPHSKPEPSLRHGARFLSQSWRLARTSMDVDLVHCADVPAAYDVAVAGRLAGVPVLAHVRNRCTFVPRRSRLFIGRATHFAFVSDDTRRSFGMRVADCQATLVHDGVEMPPEAEVAGREAVARDVRQELGLPPDTMLAAMFARVSPQKDYPTLIKAASMLRETAAKLRFVIVGDCQTVPENRRHYEQVRRLITQAGLEDRFLFTGFRTDTRRLMLAADACVLSTHFEGLPLVVLEAMSLARPCIATAVDGIPETIDDGETGPLVRHGDAAGLAGALTRVTANEGEALRLGTNASEAVRRRFGQERFAREMHDLYLRLARGRRRSTAERPARIGRPGEHHA